MRSLHETHPLTAALHLLAVIGIAMFVRNPVIQIIAITGALGYLLLTPHSHPMQRRGLSLHGYAVLLFLGFTLLNPLWNQRGETVLFFLNGKAVTLEALCYGAVAGSMLVSVLYWFAIFSRCMTVDRLLCLFGKCTPKLALVFSMGLRQSTLLSQKMQQIRSAQQAMGLSHEQNVIDRVRGSLRAFSATLSWAIENGIITADSMAARGYGVGRRTQFSLFHFRPEDALRICGTLFLSAIVMNAAAAGALTVQFYPVWTAPVFSAEMAAACSAYAMLCCYPALCALKEVILWRCLRSKMSAFNTR